MKVTVSEACQPSNSGVQLHVLSGAVSEELGDDVEVGEPEASIWRVAARSSGKL